MYFITTKRMLEVCFFQHTPTFIIEPFFYALTITNLMKDPANAAAFNQFFEQFQQQFGIN